MIKYLRPFSQIELVAAFAATITLRCLSGMSATASVIAVP
jgi:hypothetical protein